jgi:ZU5 domain
MTLTFRRLGISLALFLSVLGTGCSDGAGNPLAAEPAGPSLSASDMAPLARFREKPSVNVAWARKWIGPQGGRLELMGFAIDVPAGAVDRMTQFSLRLPMDRDGSEHVLAEFGPHNVQFRRPVSIEFPYRGTSIEGAEVPVVVWWNGGWVNVGGSVTRDGRRLRTTTDHFSTYGTTEARNNGAIATSGG